jgi:hypothetical protein
MAPLDDWARASRAGIPSGPSGDDLSLPESVRKLVQPAPLRLLREHLH